MPIPWKVVVALCIVNAIAKLVMLIAFLPLCAVFPCIFPRGKGHVSLVLPDMKREARRSIQVYRNRISALER